MAGRWGGGRQISIASVLKRQQLFANSVMASSYSSKTISQAGQAEQPKWILIGCPHSFAISDRLGRNWLVVL